MNLDILTTGGFKLCTEDRGRALAMGAVWDSRGKYWKLKTCPDDLTGMTITPRAMAVIRNVMWAGNELRRLQSATDAMIAYGEGIDGYQRVGVKFLTIAKRAILGDPVGIGKSAQFIRACYEVGASRVLVITRKSYIRNIQLQVAAWSVHNQIKWEFTNYEQVVRHPDKFKGTYDVIIVDEAIALKNRKAKRTKAIKRLCAKVPYVWLVTGTLIRNRPTELWSLLNILYPKVYTSYWKFVGKYCDTEANRWGGTDILGWKEHMKSDLADELSTILLRRSKSIISLPPLTEEFIRTTNNPTQEKIYQQLLNEFYAILGDTVVCTPTVLSQITRLRQVSCCPSLIGGKPDSAKTDTLLALLEDYTPDNKIIIFTTYREYAEHIASLTTDYGSVLITGKVTVPKRNEAVEVFDSDPSCRVLIGTYGAMSESLNIQTANIVIHANPEWVPDQIEQATGRAWRRGQTRPVHSIYLISEGTIEEHVVSLLAQKGQVITELDIITQMLRHRGE
jgi:hypothetical protein